MEQKDVKLTPELKEKLTGCLGFTVDAEFKYIPKAFRGKDIPREIKPVFVLKSLDGVQAAEREDTSGYMTLDNASRESRLHIESGTSRIETLEKGIISVDNFYFEDGSSVDYRSKDRQLIRHLTNGKTRGEKCDARDFIRFLNTTLQVELQEAINERATLTEDELQGL